MSIKGFAVNGSVQKYDFESLDNIQNVVESDSMATTYSTSATYAVGDYCWKSGQLYCCIFPITTAETWTSGHWTAVKLADNVGELEKAFVSETGRILDIKFEKGGLYVATGLEYSSPNIRTGFIPVISSKSIVCYAPTSEKGVSIYEYASDKSFITVRSGTSGITSYRWQLGSTTKFIRMQIGSNPSNLADADGIRVYYDDSVLSDTEEALLAAAHNGIVKSYNVNGAIKAYLFRDGLFAIYGTGKMPSYNANSLPPWSSKETFSQIKKIYFDPRITYGTVSFLFTRYEGGNIVQDRNRLAERIDIPADITTMYNGAFSAFEVRHLNLAKCTSNTVFSIVPPTTNRYWHTIVSIPDTIVDNDFITRVTNTITSAYAAYPYQNHAVILYITDSQELHDAIMACVDSQNNSITSKNITCILCNNLGADGFPDHWNERMKTCLLELVEFVGRQMVHYRHENSDHEYSWPVTGLSSLGNYSQYGWPVPFGVNNSKTSLWVTNEYHPEGEPTEIERKILPAMDLGSLNTFIGQPISTDLGNLAMGLSCSGFVCFVFWRYFNENFGLSASRNFYTKTGKFGQPLALVDIDEDELQPFDLISWAMDSHPDDEINELDDGGHIAIYLGSYTDANEETHHQVLQCNMGHGIQFGYWGGDYFHSLYPNIPFKYFRLKDGGNSFHYKMISRE